MFTTSTALNRRDSVKPGRVVGAATAAARDRMDAPGQCRETRQPLVNTLNPGR